MTDYSKIKQLITDADAILIGAGAGLSTSAGISYGKEGFPKHFPELYQKYGMTDMYSSSFYSFSNEEEKWSYWAKHIDYLYNVNAKEGYCNLYKLIKEKDYFVVTTNVDGQFLKAGFDSDNVFEVQGSLSKIQCSVPCHDELYDDLELVRRMREQDKDCKIPTDLVPHCPRCHAVMEVNLRKDDTFVEDEHWHTQHERYEQFLNRYQDRKLVLIELGVGWNTPGIIRIPFEELTAQHSSVTLIRVNQNSLQSLYSVSERLIAISEDCCEFIQKLL